MWFIIKILIVLIVAGVLFTPVAIAKYKKRKKK